LRRPPINFFALTLDVTSQVLKENFSYPPPFFIFQDGS
jgi:hypothetical protein